MLFVSGGSKPVSIPVCMSSSNEGSRDRFSTDSSPLSNQMNHSSASNSFPIGHGSNTMFPKHEIEQVSFGLLIFIDDIGLVAVKE